MKGCSASTSLLKIMVLVDVGYIENLRTSDESGSRGLTQSYQKVWHSCPPIRLHINTVHYCTKGIWVVPNSFDKIKTSSYRLHSRR